MGRGTIGVSLCGWLTWSGGQKDGHHSGDVSQQQSSLLTSFDCLPHCFLFEFSLHICVDELLEAHGAYLITGFECRTIIATGE